MDGKTIVWATVLVVLGVLFVVFAVLYGISTTRKPSLVIDSVSSGVVSYPVNFYEGSRVNFEAHTTEVTPKTVSMPVEFTQELPSVPTVLLSVTGLDAQADEDISYTVQATDVTPSGFKVRFTYTGTGNFLSVMVAWLAVTKSLGGSEDSVVSKVRVLATEPVGCDGQDSPCGVLSTPPQDGGLRGVTSSLGTSSSQVVFPVVRYLDVAKPEEGDESYYLRYAVVASGSESTLYTYGQTVIDGYGVDYLIIDLVPGGGGLTFSSVEQSSTSFDCLAGGGGEGVCPSLTTLGGTSIDPVRMATPAGPLRAGSTRVVFGSLTSANLGTNTATPVVEFTTTAEPSSVVTTVSKFPDSIWYSAVFSWLLFDVIG